MSKELIINTAEHETRVAWVENGNLRELFIERPGEHDIAGNIYKGRVMTVLPGMQSAFVDIGLAQSAFIYVADVVNDYYEFEQLMRIPEEVEEDDAGSSQEEIRRASRRFYESTLAIEDLLKEGQELVVQVAKAPIGKKGARVTTRISLPGRSIVLMPNTNHIGISRRIEDEAERKRLRDILAGLQTEHYGFIARTVSANVDVDKLCQERDFLISVWGQIQKKQINSSVPSLLHKELNVTLRAVRDLFTHEVDKLVIDSRQGFDEILRFLDTFMPRLKDSVELYEGDEPIFDAYNLESEISRALRKKVWLKSGGYIVIEQTEALVAIDVNTGRFVGKRNLEETILKTNLEAVKEIAHQIRLRDLGGLIVIDFIDLEKASHREKVFSALQEALKADRSRTNVFPMSELGLVQMARKRTRDTLNRMLCEPCFYCEGEGVLHSRKTICYNICRDVRRDAFDTSSACISITVHPDVADFFMGQERNVLARLERDLGKKLVVRPDPQLHLEQYEIVEGDEIRVPEPA